jgi:hypothetical protein
MSRFLALISKPPSILQVSAAVHRWVVFLIGITGLVAFVWAVVSPGIIVYIPSNIYTDVVGVVGTFMSALTVLRDRTDPAPPPPPPTPGPSA